MIAVPPNLEAQDDQALANIRAYWGEQLGIRSAEEVAWNSLRRYAEDLLHLANGQVALVRQAKTTSQRKLNAANADLKAAEEKKAAEEERVKKARKELNGTPFGCNPFGSGPGDFFGGPGDADSLGGGGAADCNGLVA